MKINGALSVLFVAAATAAITLAVLLPGQVTATNATEAVQPTIAKPTLKSLGCTFSIAAIEEAIKAGDKPTLKLTATNPTDKPVEATVAVNMTSMAPMSPMSRMMPMPRSLWKRGCTIGLKAGETKTLTLSPDVTLPAGQVISVQLTDNKQAVGLTLLTAPAPTQIAVPQLVQAAPATQR
jgi:hypothetical protein